MYCLIGNFCISNPGLFAEESATVIGSIIYLFKKKLLYSLIFNVNCFENKYIKNK